MSESTQIEIISPREVKVGNPSNLPKLAARKVLKRHFTQKEKMFINCYLSGDSAYKSAQKAGYAPSTCTAASTLVLRNARIAAELERRTKTNLKDVTADMIQKEAWKLASSNMLDYVTRQPDGSFKIDLNQVDRELGSAIQELGFDAQGQPKIRLADKKASLELMARIKKLLSDKTAPGFGEGDGQPLTIERLDNIVHQNITINQQFNVHSHEEVDLVLGQ